MGYIKVVVWEKFIFNRQCSRELIFSKEFELPCAPFYDLSIIDIDDKKEVDYIIRLNNDSFRGTSIQYNADTKDFFVNITNECYNADAFKVDGIMEIHEHLKWDRKDSTDIIELKSRLNKN